MKTDQPASGFNRREFLGNSARNAAGVAAGMFSLGLAAAREQSPNEVIRVGIIGLGQQGRELAGELNQVPGASVTAICDVDVHAMAAAQHEIFDQTGQRPLIIPHHETLLGRHDIDAVVIATPDHWHARIAMDACDAGKDIYLEQPVAHTFDEGQALLQKVKQTHRVVQTGLPQRSGAHFQSAVELLRAGTIGRVHLAKAWAIHRRRSIGKAANCPPPAGVDYTRWLGPAASRAFQPNRFHQNWTWFWDYGSGELGLWGVQLLDVVRWGLNLDLPQRIASTGGQRAFNDDRETPDTLTVQYEFPEVDVVWEHRQWSSRGIEGRTAAAAFYGEHGTLIVDRSGWKVYDGREGLYANTSEIRQSHVRNWIDCIRTRQSPTASLAIGERSMLLCHLGNISYRLGREVRFDSQSLSFGADVEANDLLRGTPQRA
ncbi:Gfo/Idh/MocA family oxidoreductase [Planctomicrobium sp. SH661]|uniref:Gfo/Idh/MocA family protein n=1 Tax=Planctomicrobium sp. SH661 TaxID=3448124 RepID=UPI003F5B06C1